MFQFMPNELVVDFSGPVGLDGGLKGCSECAQVAFRVLHLKLEGVEREVSLCGGHFTEACAKYPELSRTAGGCRASQVSMKAIVGKTWVESILRPVQPPASKA